MIAVVAVATLLTLAAGCLIGANFCAAGGAAQQGLIYLSGALSVSVLPAVPGLLQSYVQARVGAPPSPPSTPEKP